MPSVKPLKTTERLRALKRHLVPVGASIEEIAPSEPTRPLIETADEISEIAFGKSPPPLSLLPARSTALAFENVFPLRLS
jgi:hypothetical protein